MKKKNQTKILIFFIFLLKPDKNFIFFHISAQNIDCGYSFEPPRRGGSNEYPQAMFLSRNKKNNIYPCKPQFYYIKLRFLFVCVEVLRPSQPNGVMSSAVSLPSHTFTGQA